jgi:hypothetical protein
MKWSMVLPILFSLVVGHLFARPVKAESEDFRALLSQPAKPAAIVKVDTNIETGATVTTYATGHTVTITPGPVGLVEYDEFFGVKFPKDHITCIGDYEKSQNAILDKARAYNAAVMHNNAIIRAAQIRADAQNNRQQRGGTRINIRNR